MYKTPHSKNISRSDSYIPGPHHRHKSLPSSLPTPSQLGPTFVPTRNPSLPSPYSLISSSSNAHSSFNSNSNLNSNLSSTKPALAVISSKSKSKSLASPKPKNHADTPSSTNRKSKSTPGTPATDDDALSPPIKWSDFMPYSKPQPPAIILPNASYNMGYALSDKESDFEPDLEPNPNPDPDLILFLIRNCTCRKSRVFKTSGWD